jgi:hypothetical protein
MLTMPQDEPMNEDQLSPAVTQWQPKEPTMPPVDVNLTRTTCYAHLCKQVSIALGMEQWKSADDVLKEVLKRMEGDNK